MHGSMRELMRLKLRAKIYSPFIGLGIILVALGIILGLAEEDPLSIGNHTYSMILGMLSILSGIILYQSEEEFAQKYDMTHL
ncbi:MAG: hypothetical protein ACPHTH_00220, partial [Candidatus Poseidoniaceae archaeon]